MAKEEENTAVASVGTSEEELETSMSQLKVAGGGELDDNGTKKTKDDGNSSNSEDKAQAVEKDSESIKETEQNGNEKIDPVTRLASKYDDGEIYDEIEIEDMVFDEDAGIFYYPCPCGDKFAISEEELLNGEDVATCPSCTLKIRVIYDIEDFLED